MSFYKRLVGVGYALKPLDLLIIFIRIFMKVASEPTLYAYSFTGTKTVLTGTSKSGKGCGYHGLRL